MRKQLVSIIALTGLSLSTIGFGTVQIGYASTPMNQEERSDHQLITQRAISKEEAKSIALKQVKGRVIYVDIDTDNGVMKYEVIIITDQNKVYEVEINANTGQVIKVEQEND